MEGSITVIAPEVKMYWLLKCHLLCEYSYPASDRVFLFSHTGSFLKGDPSWITPLQPVINDRRKLNRVCRQIV